MRKFILSILLSVAMLPLFAQHGPYNRSLGITLGSDNGLAYKTFFADHSATTYSAFELDLFWRPITTSGSVYYGKEPLMPGAIFNNINYWTLALNPNYEFYHDFGNNLLYYGIGLNAGWSREFYKESPDYARVGANAIIGFEHIFRNANLALSLDCRPGYACLMNPKTENGFLNVHMFDWSLSIGLHYVFGNFRDWTKK